MENNTHISSESNTPVDTQQYHKKRSRNGSVVARALFGIVFGFIGGVMAFSILPYVKNYAQNPFIRKIFHQTSDQNIKATNDINTVVSTAEDTTVINTVEKASPAVVSVVISQDVPKLQSAFGSPFEFPFFMMPQDNQNNGSSDQAPTQKQTIGQGSGFLVSADGLIVTNKHVVSSKTADYTIIGSDGKKYSAKVLARDPNRDIALIKIDAKDLPYLQLGNSDDVKVGQTVVAIGNSLGEFSNTVSKGIISGLKRNLVAGSDFGGSERLSDIIQTDAAINPGNSGGPLLDVSGNVIGVNVAMAQGAQSIGFALPANQIKKIIDQVQSTGKITTAFLGVRYIILTPDMQKEQSLPLDHGALILRGDKMTDFAVIPGSPADKAGLVENDIITEIDNTAIDSDHQIADLVADHKPGDVLSLTVWHKGETKTISVTLEERK